MFLTVFPRDVIEICVLRTQRTKNTAHLLLSANLGYTNGIIIIIITKGVRICLATLTQYQRVTEQTDGQTSCNGTVRFIRSTAW